MHGSSAAGTGKSAHPARGEVLLHPEGHHAEAAECAHQDERARNGAAAVATVHSFRALGPRGSGRRNGIRDQLHARRHHRMQDRILNRRAQLQEEESAADATPRAATMARAARGRRRATRQSRKKTIGKAK